jgi:glutamate synthase (NADPH/NADH) large chain
MDQQQPQKIAPLWRPEFEHDNCGTGFVAHALGVKSHSIIKDALEVLNRLNHRGGAGSDPDTGDGAGILTQIPDAFFKKSVDFSLPEEGLYAVAQIFLSRDQEKRSSSEKLISEIIKANGHHSLGIRSVPVNLMLAATGPESPRPG